MPAGGGTSVVNSERGVGKGGSQPSLTKEQVAYAIYLYTERGWRQRDIADYFHVHQNTISRYMRLNGVPTQYNHLSCRDPALVRLLYHGPRRLNTFEIGKRLGISQKAVLRIMRREGIPIRPATGGRINRRIPAEIAA